MSWVADADRSPAAWPRLRLSSQRATGGMRVNRVYWLGTSILAHW